MENVVALPHLGYVTRQNYTAYFQGAVDDVALWKRSMGQSEVAAIHTAGRNEGKPLGDLLAAGVPDWSMY